MEVMLWEALLRSVRKRCESINIRSCWLAPDTKEGRNDVLCLFRKEKAPRFLNAARCLFFFGSPKQDLWPEQWQGPYADQRTSNLFLFAGVSFQILEKLTVCGKNE